MARPVRIIPVHVRLTRHCAVMEYVENAVVMVIADQDRNVVMNNVLPGHVVVTRIAPPAVVKSVTFLHMLVIVRLERVRIIVSFVVPAQRNYAVMGYVENAVMTVIADQERNAVMNNVLPETVV